MNIWSKNKTVKSGRYLCGFSLLLESYNFSNRLLKFSSPPNITVYIAHYLVTLIAHNGHRLPYAVKCKEIIRNRQSMNTKVVYILLLPTRNMSCSIFSYSTPVWR